MGTVSSARMLVRGLWERAWVVLLCSTVAAGLAFGYLKLCPRIFAATVVLQIEPAHDGGRLGPAGESVDDFALVERQLRMRPLLARVIRTNGLDRNEHFMIGPVADSAAQPLVSALDKMLKVTRIPGTRFLQVTVAHADPRLAEQLATSLVREFLAQSDAQRRPGIAEQAGLLASQATP